jgi:ribosomal protein L24E
MSAVLLNETRKAAKRHWCWFCAQPIEKGDSHTYRTGVGEDGYWSMRCHPECEVYAQHTHWDYEVDVADNASPDENKQFRQAALAHSQKGHPQ